MKYTKTVKFYLQLMNVIGAAAATHLLLVNAHLLVAWAGLGMNIYYFLFWTYTPLDEDKNEQE